MSPSTVAAQLSKNKYVIPLRAHLDSEEALNRFTQLQKSFGNLSEDPYMNPEHRGTRTRRYGRFDFDFTTGELSVLPNIPYVPGNPDNHNQYQQGKPRLFEPLENETADNELLQDIIRTFAVALPDDIKKTPAEIKLQQIRIIASGEANASPTPEGIHRDGETYVCVLIANRENITGGEVKVYDKAGQNVIVSFTPETLDSYIIDDREVMHGVTPICPIDASKPGYRDVFIINFNPVK